MKFVKLNLNPKNKQACDCVIRAISKAYSLDYWKVVTDLFNVYKKYGYIINERKCYEKYLKNKKATKLKMPSGKKYTILEFVENFANKNSTYIIKLYDHLTCVKNGVLFDTWDCGNRKIFTVWEI